MTFVDPKNEHGIQGYNGLWLKEVGVHYPETMGDGDEKSHISVTEDRVFVKSFPGKRLPRKPEGYSEKRRPRWHSYVCGCRGKKR